MNQLTAAVITGVSSTVPDQVKRCAATVPASSTSASTPS
jgi:hypothetical protein